MERKDVLPLARGHGFGGFEVGCRMMGLINEIEQMIRDEMQRKTVDDIAQLEQENRQLRARIERLTDCAGAQHATS